MLKAMRANSESGSQRDFRFPRFKRNGLESRFSHLAGQLLEREPLADNTPVWFWFLVTLGFLYGILAMCGRSK
jgi:hypothetical protein